MAMMMMMMMEQWGRLLKAEALSGIRVFDITMHTVYSPRTNNTITREKRECGQSAWWKPNLIECIAMTSMCAVQYDRTDNRRMD